MLVTTEAWDAAALEATDFGPTPIEVWHDTFSGVNGTALAAHTPNLGPGGYTDDTPGLGIQTNHLQSLASGTDGTSSFDPAVVDFTLQLFTVAVVTNLNFVSFRGVDTANKYQVNIGPSAQTLVKYVAGTPTTLGSATATIGGLGVLIISAIGSLLTVKFGGTVIIQVTDTTYPTETRMEIKLHNGGTPSVIDDLVVTTPP